jgi:CRP-like cAMP-binding protein
MDKAPHSSNLLLASLPPEEMATLLPHLRTVQLRGETVLYESGDTIKVAYFPHGGLISLVVDLASGEAIEVATVGRRSLIGGSSAFSNQTFLNRAVVQVSGAASLLEVGRFRELAQRSQKFMATIAEHEQFILAQAAQSAACNASHALEARLSRWLLRCHDLVGDGNDIPLTQEFIAEMLGVRRTSITLSAHELQQAGLIQYRRGHIRVTDREGLRKSACECYERVRAHGNRLLGSPAA